MHSTKDVAVRQMYLLRFHGYDTSEQKREQYLHNLSCQRTDEIRDLTNGLDLCRGKPDSLAASWPFPGGASYEFNNLAFPTFLGIGFAANCPPGAPIGGLGWCHTALILSKDVEIDIEFYPPNDLSEENFPKKFLAFMAGVTSRITQTISPVDYPWR
jgi:hypothetical protein